MPSAAFGARRPGRRTVPAMVTSWVDRFEPWPVALFCAITLFIWGNRIWLAWTNPDDSLTTKLIWSTPITLFVIAGLVLGFMVVSGAHRSQPHFAAAVVVFAAGTVVYWAIRAPIIFMADHDVAFKAVHGVLASVSILAALGAWRAVR